MCRVHSSVSKILHSCILINVNIRSGLAGAWSLPIPSSVDTAGLVSPSTSERMLCLDLYKAWRDNRGKNLRRGGQRGCTFEPPHKGSTMHCVVSKDYTYIWHSTRPSGSASYPYQDLCIERRLLANRQNVRLAMVHARARRSRSLR